MTSPQQILIVEDSEIFGEMLTLLIRGAGMQPTLHIEPRAALWAAKAQRFDLVISDFEFPDTTGTEFLRDFRQIQPHTPVIFISGRLTLERAAQLSDEGVAALFTKPADPRALLEKVMDVLALSASTQPPATPDATADHEDPGADDDDSRGHTDPGSSVLKAIAAARAGHPSPGSAAPMPLARYIVGSSEKTAELLQRIHKARDFRTALLIQGEPGSAFQIVLDELLAASTFAAGPRIYIGPEEFSVAQLPAILEASLHSEVLATLIISWIEVFTVEQRKLLTELLAYRGVFSAYRRRLRVALVTSSNLAEAVEQGLFERDLFFKVSPQQLYLPAIREIQPDASAIARSLLTDAANTGIAVATGLTPAAAGWLEREVWPGNYDELRQTVLHAAMQAPGRPLTTEDLAASAAEARRLAEQGLAMEPISLPAVTVLPPAEAAPPSPPSAQLHAAEIEAAAQPPPPWSSPETPPAATPAPAPSAPPFDPAPAKAKAGRSGSAHFKKRMAELLNTPDQPLPKSPES